MKDILITSLETITAFDVLTGAYKFTLDELQDASLAQGEEKTDLTGKQGRKLSSLKRNKTVTISGTNGIVSGGLLETQVGSKFETKTTQVMWTETLTVNSSHVAETTYGAVGEGGHEIDGLFIRNNDGTLGTELHQADSASSGYFTYSNKTLTFNSDVLDGTEVVVYYNRNISADVLENYSDKYSGKCALYIDALGEDKCANVYRIQIYIPKADFNGEFTLEMGDNQSVHAFEAESLAGGCGAGGVLWTYTVFGNTAEAMADVPTLKSIAITTAPTKTSGYSAGDAFDATGMVVTATYSTPGAADTTAVVTGYSISPLTNLTASDTTITISYTEGGITKTATQAITFS